jgi:short-subunit dehydrogenase
MFEGKSVWITGGSSGIGEALALQFADRGAKITLSSRREDELERVRGLCLDRSLDIRNTLVLPLDVTSHDAMPAAVEKVTSHFGAIDMLINNAGISQRSLCIDTDMSVYRKLFEVDVLGQIALTKAVLPLMYEQGKGHIAIMSSVAGKIGVSQRTGYCAAKHAVMGFYDALRAEADHHGIQVTTITPGYIRTNVSINALRGDGTKFGAVDGDIEGGMDVDECAAVIMKGFEKGLPEIPVGEGLEMQALWLKRFVPRAVFRKVARMARPG